LSGQGYGHNLKKNRHPVKHQNWNASTPLCSAENHRLWSWQL